MLNLVWVRTFLALVENKSFQAAATQLKLAQPTVSQQIRKLEQQLGVLLVRRARSGCEPTQAAFTFLPYAESLIRINQRALAAIQSGQVRVGASSNVGIYMLQPYVRTFLNGRDPALFDLVIDRNPVIAQKLVDAEIDVAVMEWWDRRPGFAVEEMAQRTDCRDCAPDASASPQCPKSRKHELATVRSARRRARDGNGSIARRLFQGLRVQAAGSLCNWAAPKRSSKPSRPASASRWCSPRRWPMKSAAAVSTQSRSCHRSSGKTCLSSGETAAPAASQRLLS